MHLKSGLIREVVFGRGDLTRGELFSKRNCNIQNETTGLNNISVITVIIPATFLLFYIYACSIIEVYFNVNANIHQHIPISQTHPVAYTNYSPVGMSCSATGFIMSDSLGRCLTCWCLDTVQCVYKSFTLEPETDTY